MSPLILMPPISTDRWPVYLEGIRNAKMPCSLLETGRMHNATNAYFYGDGASTLLFANQACIERVYSIDIDPQSEEICKYIIDRATDRIEFINDNSIDALPTLKGICFGVILLDSAEDSELNASELLLCIENGLMDENTILLLDDTGTKSKRIMDQTEYYVLIAKNDRCAAIRIFDLPGIIKQLI